MIYSILILLFSSTSFAQVFLGYSYAPRLERETSGHRYELDSRHALYAGYLKNAWKAKLQYSFVENETKNGISSIEVKSQELVAWGMHELPFTAFDVKYYAGLGLGITWDEIDTTLGAQTVSDKSDREIVLGAVFEGVKYVLPQFSIGSDVKIIYSQYYSQRPTIELGLIQLTFYF